MKALAKVDIVNKYRAPRKFEVAMTAQERKEYRRLHPKAVEEDFFKI